MNPQPPQLTQLSLSVLLAMTFWSAWTTFPAHAQGPIVTTTDPISNTNNVTSTTNITVTFDTAIDLATVNTQSLTIRGEQTGIYTGSYSLPSTNTILIDPSGQFRAGEVVRVVASSQIESSGAITATPYQWQFITTSQDGTGTGDVWQKQTIPGSILGADDVIAADVDGDGDLDVLSASYFANDITWWENDGSQTFTEHTIAGSFDGAWEVAAADVDGDGDLDVLGAAVGADAITWWENDGSQTFSEHTLDDSFDGANSVIAADVDGDGDLDVLGAAKDDDEIAWWENDGSQNFTKQTIASGFNRARSVTAADVDGDGDLDVLGAAFDADAITWWENDGSQIFSEHTIADSFGGAESVTAADVDGDGDLDVLGAAYGADDITWWENDGSQTFSEHTIAGSFNGANSVIAADVDGDGDLDVIGGANGAQTIAWWENDGSQNFTKQTIAGSLNGLVSIYTADVDGDGDLDVLGAAEYVRDISVWYNTAPEIAVVGNGIEISNGDTSPTIAADTDFGTITVGQTLTHTFTISSNGTSATDDLILSGSPTITLTNSIAFTVTQPASTTLAPGETTTFTLIFDPQSEGTFTDTVTILNNDTDEAPTTFVIGGEGSTPEITVLGAGFEISSGDTTPTSVDGTDFGTLTPPDTLTHTFTISNSGEGALTISSLSLTAGEQFTVTQPTSTTLQAGQTTTFTVIFDPSSADVLTDTVSLSSNDPDESPYTFVISGTGVCSQPTIYVNQAASAGGDGSSWGSAYRGVSPALTQAADYAEICTPVEVWVAQGRYVPGLGLDRTQTFTMTEGVQLYGGFAGGETQRDQRDWETNLTVLSGDNQNNDTADASGVVTDTANIIGDNRYHVVTADGTSDPITADTVLDGFTITAGQANVTGDNDGGGFICYGSGSECSPTLNNITFSGNLASDSGGAMFNFGSSSGQSNPTLNNVTFYNNTSEDWGGAMFNWGYQGESSPVLNRVTFIGNTAANDGGAMYNYGSNGLSSPSLNNVLFLSNTSTTRSGGAIYNDGGDGGESSPSLVNVTFYNNSADDNGGAIINDALSGGVSTPTLENVILWENTATSGDQLYNGDANPTISYTLIQSDTGDIEGVGSTISYGSGILTGDPLFVDAVGGDLRLDDTSPAIDAGDNAATEATTDLDGNDRFYNDLAVSDTGIGTAPIVDMGAYEKQSNSGPVPDISLIGNGQVITNGNTSPSLLDDTDFDAVTIGQSVTHTFTISNEGDLDLTLSGSPAITLTGGSIFTVTQPASTTLAAGESTTFTLTFAPQSVNSFTDTVTIANDDPDESPYTFVVGGSGVAPEIILMGNGVEISNGDTSPTTADDTDFGLVLTWSQLAHTFTISNSGTADLSLSGSPAITLTNSTHFTVTQPLSTTIAPGETTTFTLTFDPQSGGILTTTVSIDNNDPDENPTTFEVQGKGSGGQVQAVYPVENSLNVTATSPISLNYNTDIASSSISTATVTVRGEQTGIYSGSYSLTDSDTILITPTNSFKAGEVVRVVASSQVENTAAVTTTPYQWQFTATSQDGTGSGDVWQEQTIADDFNGASDVHAADVDGDGDLDVLGTNDMASDISWWENDGSQNFTEHAIKGTFAGARSVTTADVDSDGDLDVLGAALDADDITWWENDGSQNFTEHTIKGTFNGANSVTAADVDGDGDVDVLGAAYYDDAITWWENDGNQNFSEHTIADSFVGARSVTAADMDSDGDVDVLGAAYDADAITWWENDGSQNFSEHTIKDNFNGAEAVYAADVDGDGDLDVLGAAYSAADITWWENDGSQNFTEYTIKGNFTGARSVTAADVDGDGDLDVLGAAQSANDITWWENDGSQVFTEHTIDGNFGGARSVTTADVDGDGDVDVLGAANDDDDITVWYNMVLEIAVVGNGVEISNGDTSPTTADDTDFGTVTLGDTPTHTFTISSNGIDDLTLSGTSPIILSNGTAFTVTQPASTTLASGETTTFTISFAPTSEGSFTDTVTIANNDVDENPYTFVIEGKARSQILAVYPLENSLNVTATSSVSITYDMDIVADSVSTATVTVRGEQTGIYNGSYSLPEADTILITPTSPFKAGEVVRVVSSSQVENTAAISAIPYQWQFTATSQDGSGTGDVWQEQTIASSFNGAYSVYAADVDGDGDMDILGAALDADDITWWENDGNQNFTEHTIADGFDGAYSVYAADVDGDGDLDVLGAALYADDITWWENDGNQNFSEHTIAGSFDWATSVYAADVDGDGDLDVLGAANTDKNITWWENDGSQNFTKHNIASLFDASSVYAADMDVDGDLDVLGASDYDDKIAWWENDGNQNFSTHTLTNSFEDASSVYAADMDGDGDMDVLGAATTADDITWWENDGSQNFSEHTIDGSFEEASSVYAADVDGDGDLDVLGAATTADDITWWENDGSQNFTKQTIKGNFNGAKAVYAADVDGDGDMDMLGAAQYDDDITVWYNVVPEITVLGNGSEISNGDTSPTTANDTDFGNLTIGDTLTHTFTISNNGTSATDDLVLSGSPTITLSNGTAFTLTQPLSTTLASGEATTFSLTFNPQSEGSFTDTVNIANNDADENPTTFVVSGTSACPDSPIYVDQAAGGNNNGIGWADAFTDLQDGLSLAESCAPSEIWVAAGIYTPGTSRSDTFTLNSDIALYGGFAATETLRTERDWETNITVLSGDIDGNDTTDANGVVLDPDDISGNNSYHVVWADGSTDPITASTVLDGFTITAGKANFNPGVGPNPDAFAGGLYCYSCDVALNNLTFSGNSALYWGGAMVNTAGSPSLNNVIFSGNSAAGGGAMYNASGSPSLANVIFSGNSAIGGGAIYNIAYDGSLSPSLVNVTFSGNSADDGGAILNYANGGTISPALSNVILWGNTATGNGSQIYNDGATPVISYSLIQSDTSDIYNDNGASITYGSNILTSDPLFVDTAGTDGITGTLDDDLRLLPGSPAIDSGDNASAPAEDIAGVSRPVNSVVDMGAYESQGFSLSITGGNNQSTLIDTAFVESLEVTISSAAAEPVGPGGVISFTAPSSGAGVTTSTLTATTTSSGVASVTVTANSTLGSYLVEAAANGVASPSNFTLTNTISDTTPPDITGLSLITPINGTNLTDLRPIFDWDDATDSQSGVVSYTLLMTSSNVSLSLQEATDTITTTLSEFTPSADLATGVYTWTVRAHDAAGNASDYVSPAATFTIESETNAIYFPLLIKEVTGGPDLVIDDVVATSSHITVTLRNAGDQAVSDAFWVDVTFNPNQTPGLNQPWDTIAPAGATWGVSQSLSPGETLVLTVGGDYYFGPPDSSATFPVGASVYAYVDSVNYDTDYGNVPESNETNNLFGPIISTAGVDSAAVPVGASSVPEGLPERTHRR